MSFRKIMDDLLIAVNKAQIEAQNLELKFEGGPGIDYFEDLEYRRAPRPAKERLKTYLTSLSDDDVFKIQTIMYAGREHRAINSATDFFDFHKAWKETLPKTKEGAVQRIVPIAPGTLFEYLSDGLKLANTHGIDIEQNF